MLGASALLAFGVAASFVSSASARTGRTVATSGSVTFTDPAGDSQGAPDLTSVTINGDPATGLISFTVTGAGYMSTAMDTLTREIDLFMDTDMNSATGSKSGSEYALMAWNDASGSKWNLSRWDGSTWAMVPQSGTISFRRSGDVPTWTASTADLGGATGFRFYAWSGLYDTATSNLVASDFAPDGDAWWTYDISATTPPPPTATTTTTTPANAATLKISSPTTSPSYPVAGKRFTVKFRVDWQKQETATVIDISTGGENGTATIVSWDPVSSGTMICDPSVAGKVIKHTESFTAGTARLSFLVPKSAKGKQLKVKLTIKAKQQSATKVVTFRVH